MLPGKPDSLFNFLNWPNAQVWISCHPTEKSSLKFSFTGLRKRILQLPIEEASFARRGFWGGDSRARTRLECIGKAFLFGYHAALEETNSPALAQQLSLIDLELRGFSFEGAAMGLTLFDLLTPWKRDRWRSLLNHTAGAHQYMMHVGAGWALARLQPWFKKHSALADPLFGWLVVDGYGFHQGYFNWPRYVVEQDIPRHLSGYAYRAFDQGLGRSLWFVDGADVGRIPVTIAAFSSSRHADLWSGVGLACSYAGGAHAASIETLKNKAGPYRPQLAQGATFAAKARQRAGNRAEHTDMTCRILCDLSADAAATVTDKALKDLLANEQEPAFEIWRKRIQERFKESAQ